MQSKSYKEAMINEMPLLDDIWTLILANLNDVNLRSMMTANKYFKNLVEKSNLLQRPKWY